MVSRRCAASSLAAFRRDEDAGAFPAAAADASAKLVKLRQAEAFGVLDDHDRGVRNVHADFDDRGRDQHIDFAAAEIFHDLFFFVAAHAAVQQADAELRKDGCPQPLEFDDGGFQRSLRLCRLRLLDHGIDDVGLAAGGDFAPQKIPHARQVLRSGPARFNRRAAGRHLVDHGNVEIAVERERKRARNGRGGHHQHVGRMDALFDQPLALQHAEAMLLVHNHQAQLGEGARGLRAARACRRRACASPVRTRSMRRALFRGLAGR